MRSHIIICRYVLILNGRPSEWTNENKLMVCKREHATYIRPKLPNKRKCVRTVSIEREGEREKMNHIRIKVHPNWFAHSLLSSFFADWCALLFFLMSLLRNEVYTGIHSEVEWNEMWSSRPFSGSIYTYTSLKWIQSLQPLFMVWKTANALVMAYHIKAIGGTKCKRIHAHPVHTK